MDGFPDIMRAKLGAEYNIILPEDREHACFNGMSVLASLPTFQDMVITP